jgi:hypothetical protein
MLVNESEITDAINTRACHILVCLMASRGVHGGCIFAGCVDYNFDWQTIVCELHEEKNRTSFVGTHEMTLFTLKLFHTN